MMNVYSGGGDAARRRDEVLRIVRDTAVHSQDELLGHLRRRGFRVTQPTLSRDLRELGLAKTPAGYVTPADLAATHATNAAPLVAREAREHRLDQLLHDSVLTAEAAVNMVVIKTPIAAAQPVASAIDATSIDDLLGTIGGDDTIFLCFRTPAAAEAFARRIQDVAGIQPPRRSPRS